MANVTIAVDLPPGVAITGSQRPQDGHGFAVRWPWPERGRCPRGGQEDHAPLEFTMIPQAVRDRDVGGQPSFWIDHVLFHRWARWDSRPHLLPPFQRTDTADTDRFEPFVLRSLIGRTAAEVARRRGIAAATVERIVASQWAEDRPLDPQRGITDSGREELSLKKRHRLDVTWLTDRSDPARPPIWAGAWRFARRGGPSAVIRRA